MLVVKNDGAPPAIPPATAPYIRSLALILPLIMQVIVTIPKIPAEIEKIMH
jgi:hypothetical protein